LTGALPLEASTARAEALASLKEWFELRGVESPAREARISLCAASGLSQADLIADPRKPLGSSAPRIETLAARRAAGEPLSRILGKREFWGIEFAVSPDVLDPRPETETIVEAAIGILSDRRDQSLRILDLGVGSGALLCALIAEFPAARGLGVDVSASAANVARGNVEACGLALRAEIRVGSWMRGVPGPFDLIVSNPPYIATAELPLLPREVRDFDPWIALDGGFDGLAAYREIMAGARSLLAPGGWLIAEFGARQGADVTAIAKGSGFAEIAIRKDLSGLDRIVVARR